MLRKKGGGDKVTIALPSSPTFANCWDVVSLVIYAKSGAPTPYPCPTPVPASRPVSLSIGV